MKIQACTRVQLPAVIELLAEQPLQSDPRRHTQLGVYWEKIYFDNPWYDPDLSSLICEGPGSQVDGFCGAVPLLLDYRGSPIRAVSTSNFRARTTPQGGANPFVALKMLKTLLSGPQDLSVAHNGNLSAKKIWEASGGVAVPLYSLDWLRALRPARALFELAQFQRPIPAKRSLRCVADAFDVLGRSVVRSSGSSSSEAYRLEKLDETSTVDLLGGINNLDLRPRYEPGSFDWLLDMCAQSGHGEIFRAFRVVDKKRSSTVGSFVYYQRSDRVGHVLQLVALPGCLSAVLRMLIQDASTQGIALLRGDVDPNDLQAYRDNTCLMNTGRWMLIHSRRSELIDAFIRGRALFTGLDGERWFRPIERNLAQRAARAS